MGQTWVSQFFKDVDSVQIDTLAAWFADDIDMRFSNFPPVHGKEQAVLVLGDFYKSIGGMQHEPEAVLGDESQASQHGTVTYTRLDGGKVPLPCATYLHRNANGHLDRLWVCIDIHPLHAEALVS